MSEEKKHRKGYKGKWKWRDVADGMKPGDSVTAETTNDARALRLALERRGKRCRFETVRVKTVKPVIVHCVG